jgi:hypothetical protein
MMTRLKTWWLKRQIRQHLKAMKHAGKHRNGHLHQQHYQKVRDLYTELRRTDPRCPEWKDLRAEP